MKKLILILCLLVSLFSCKENEEKKVETNTAASANEKIVRQLYEHFNNHNWAKMASLYTNPADFRDPSLGQNIVQQTHEQTIKKYTELSQMIKDLRDDVTAIYPSGDKHIIVEFTSSGIAPDGSKFTLPICNILTIENGKITKDFTYYDNMEEPK
jgi:ketosteroid isomerase-like protein